MTGRPTSHAPSSVRSACGLVLAWLAARDLSAAEIRLRLRRRGCPNDMIDPAIEHLRGTGAIDDRRVALGRARVEASLRGRGRERVLLRLRSIGIDAETARHAVDAVFEEVEEDALLARALARRLKPPDRPVAPPAEYRRLFAALVRQGFAPAAVRKALDERRARSSEFGQDEGESQD